MRRHARMLIIAVLAVGLMAFFLRRADLRQVWTETTRARADLLLFTLATIAFNFAWRAARWVFLLAPLGRVPFTAALRATLIGFAALFLLPARAGDVLRPYVLAKREGLSAAAAFSTILLERLLDLVAVLMLLGAFLLLFDPGIATSDRALFTALRTGGLMAAAASIAALAVAVALAGHPDRLGAWARHVERVLPARLAETIEHVVRRFAEGFAIARQPQRLLIALALSFPLWISIAAGFWATARAFHIAMPFTGSFVMVALGVVGVAVPTPGGVGGFHEAFRIGATAFYGATNDRAVGAALVLHAISFIPVTIVGVILAAQDGLSVSGMRRLADRDDRARSNKGEPGEMPVLRPSGR